eukprot:gene1164-2670_t
MPPGGRPANRARAAAGLLDACVLVASCWASRAAPCHADSWIVRSVLDDAPCSAPPTPPAVVVELAGAMLYIQFICRSVPSGAWATQLFASGGPLAPLHVAQWAPTAARPGLPRANLAPCRLDL